MTINPVKTPDNSKLTTAFRIPILTPSQLDVIGNDCCRASSTVKPLPKPPRIPTPLPTVECPYCQHPILVAMVKMGENICPKCRKTYIAEW
jgi:DNA-directed RNA polymerase subunit RPC12/RpoP